MNRWQPGELIADRFRIEARLTSGGMAEIFVAEMTAARGVVRRVAIKRIHPHLADDPSFVTMFLDEARVSSQLGHPGLVPVLDAVEHEGSLLLVLGYVPGWDLAAVLRLMRDQEIAMPFPVVLQVGRDLADTLAYVHTACDLRGRPLRIVHRDVTPANLLIAEDGSLRLLDFGIAKAAARVTRTRTATLKGKMAYAAPEQVLGKPVSARTDLYCMGLVLYELATRQRVIDGPDELACIELAKNPRPVAASTIRPELPRAFDRLIDHLLTLSPDGRPEDAHEVARQVESLAREIGGVSRHAVRDFVGACMSEPSRPVERSPRVLERALAEVAGVTPGEATRAPVGSPSDPRPEVPPLRPSLPPAARGARRWSALLGVLASLGVVAAVATDFRPNEVAQTPVPVRDERASPSAFIRITTTPPGASVTVDAAPWPETTPTVIPSPPNRSVTIGITLDDHVPITRVAEAAAGETLHIRETLRRLRGRLRIETEPPGARVTLGGQEMGKTPITLDDLPREDRELRLALEGYAPYTTAVPLGEQAEHAVDVTLRRRVAYGRLDVSTTPWAAVSVDGRVVAESTPATGIRLPIGEHTVTLTNPHRGLRQRRVVRIRHGETTQLVVRLH